MNHTKNWIEVIGLTLAAPEDSAKFHTPLKEVKTSPALRTDDPVKVSLYRNINAETDWIIHLSRELEASRPGKDDKNLVFVCQGIDHKF
ncbi:hypothetical protein KJ966_02615 [bacterium]|nr:hypothetical protein [bacterium]